MVKKVLKWLFGILAVLLIAALIGGWLLFGTLIKAANSITKLEEELYSMEYHGDYGFEKFLEAGGAADEEALSEYLTSFLSRGFYKPEANVETGDFGCSTVCVSDNAGNTYFGRNYDWADCKTIIVHTYPKDGYESVSTCCLDFLGFGDSYVPDGSMPDRFMTLAAIYVPLDGMNEKGLMIADLMAGDKEETHQKTDKTDLTTTTSIRLLLDRAANVDEAVELLKQYDMNSDIGAAHHLSIADASGNSVVVEYVNGEMIVTETKVVTNHYIGECAKQGVGSDQSHIRFDTLCAFTGSGDKSAVKSLLESVAQKNYVQGDGSYEKTMWSIVYAPAELSAEFYYAENYSKAYPLKIGK